MYGFRTAKSFRYILIIKIKYILIQTHGCWFRGQGLSLGKDLKKQPNPSKRNHFKSFKNSGALHVSMDSPGSRCQSNKTLHAVSKPSTVSSRIENSFYAEID